MAKIIRQKDLDAMVFEPPISCKWGIESKTVDNPQMIMSHVIIPPKGRNQRHYHIKPNVGMHVLKGRLQMFFGPNHEQQEAIVEVGDFVFVRQGEIHGLLNLSDTEPAEMVVCFSGTANWEETQTVFVEPPGE